ncbi:MAG: PKD domain-containing protein [Bacteroidales bacterium]|nr:PKD domain-containing protein [Bacteroidales bacterium]
MRKHSLLILSGALFLALIVLFSGCKKDDEDEPENRNPTISAVVVNPATVAANGTVTVTVTAGDPDGDGITYAYTVSGGAIQGNGATATWTAPNAAGSYSVTVTVSDGKGGQASNNGSLTVTAPVTQVTGTASFPAGTNGDLGNAKVSIYTSWDNWFNNQPLKFVAVTGTGPNVNFTMTDIVQGAYYLDVWKDNDNDANWSIGDFVGWFGSGGLGSPNLTQFQISEGETKNVNITMYILAKGATFQKIQ